MANINDYLLFRGDIPISSRYKFNEVDSLILARFSYLIFNKIDIKKKETIGSISKKMKDFPNEKFMYNGDKEMITLLGQSDRFKNMIVTDYERNNNRTSERQFCAITIHISNKEMYLSFMGTDSSIYGWKEDFNMSFSENVPCQVAGKEYTEKLAKKYRLKKIRLGGHSKGGNVAIYSAIMVKKEIQNRIIKVYNYDGPGFSQDFTHTHIKSRMLSKIETYIPQESIIGRLLNHKEKITIIKSLEKNIFQHDVFSWQVTKDDLVHLTENTDFSEDIDKALTRFIEITTIEERKLAIDVLFDLFYSSEFETFSDITQNLSVSVPKILSKYKNLSKTEKKNMTDLIIIIVKAYLNNFSQREKSKITGKIKGKFESKGVK